LESELKGIAHVIRLDITDQIGSTIAERYNIQVVPTVLVINNDGQVSYKQVGIPDPDHVLSAVKRSNPENIKTKRQN